jgi:hypothetical protein
MKQLTAFCLALAIVTSGLTVARAVEQVHRTNTLTARATVERVDQKKRVVTLKDEKGKMYTIKAEKGVRNLSELKPGDQVSVTYHESLLVQMAKPGQQPVASAKTDIERSAPGEKPGGKAVETLTTTATVVGINRHTSEITLKGPAGDVVKVKAEDPRNLEDLKTGDKINITYTQAVAVRVEKANG